MAASSGDVDELDGRNPFNQSLVTGATAYRRS
jgi:hypothetical protein